MDTEDYIEVLLRRAMRAEELVVNLRAENARLRQRLDFVIDQLSNATEDAALLLKQRNAANAQLDFILDNLKEEKAP